ncbi:hypothetical protein KY289_030355 [Solanum tuberosum]|nr:hypothetical protein KY289_030355 [Solanum tuberosum]
MTVGEKLLELMPVNIYKLVHEAKKAKLLELMQVKDLHAQSGMHSFTGNDFRVLTSMYIWWEDWYNDEIRSLMRERKLRYPEHYDSRD